MLLGAECLKVQVQPLALECVIKAAVIDISSLIVSSFIFKTQSMILKQ